MIDNVRKRLQSGDEELSIGRSVAFLDQGLYRKIIIDKRLISNDDDERKKRRWSATFRLDGKK